MRPYNDIAGNRYGKLVAVKYAGRRQKIGTLWLCMCDCGTEKVIAYKHLSMGRSRSCGCLHHAPQKPRGKVKPGTELAEMTFAEIGAALSISPQAAQMTFDRAIKKMKRSHPSRIRTHSTKENRLMSRTLTKEELATIIADHLKWLGGVTEGRRAYLRGADLTDADLRGADLTDADLRGARRDLYKILRRAAAEAPGLLQALRDGKVDGSVYTGECACLVGTIANIRGVSHQSLPGIVPDGGRPAERLFMAIRQGDTPATNPIAKVVEGWIVDWLAERAATPEAQP